MRIRQQANIVSDGFWQSPLGWLKCVWKRLDASRSLGLAAEMAFWLFLSMLPLAAVAGLVAAKLALDNGSIMTALLASLPLATREMVSGELGRVAAWNGGKVGFWAGITFIWLASSGIHSIFDGIEIESEATPRPWWKKRALAIATCVGLSAGIALLALLVSGLGWWWHLVGGSTLLQAFQAGSSVVGKIARLVIGAAVAIGLVAGLYWVALPPAARKKMPVLPGALVAMALQIALGFGYGFYIAKAGDGGAYQAGLASIGVTLIALYLSCLALLVGIEVNQMMGERRRPPVGPDRAARSSHSAPILGRRHQEQRT